MLIRPHGGKLINRQLSAGEVKKVLAKKLTTVVVADDTIFDLEKIAIGAYSPLTGFMSKLEIDSVVHNMRLPNGIPWTIPIFLPIEDEIAAKLSKNQKIFLAGSNKLRIAVMEIKEIFSYPKEVWAKKVYGTNSLRHPGVKRLQSFGNKFASGPIMLIQQTKHKFTKLNLDPFSVRKLIKERGWKTVCGFQTRNIPHRAHEYLQKIALSICDGLLIHPIIGWKKEGDFAPQIIIETYKTLIKEYYPKNSVIFAGLTTAMRYAGPREAVFHAIIRKNYGCTHFIIGRDHAGVGDFYKKYEAHEIFKHFPDLGITPLLLCGPYYCKKCHEIVNEKICPHHEKWHQHISGTTIRERLRLKKDIPEYLLRPEVVKTVIDFNQNNRGDWQV